MLTQGCFTMKYSRYRVVYKAEKDELPNGDVVVHVKVVIVAVGIRKEKDKSDVYEIAQKLMKLDLISGDNRSDNEETEEVA